MLDGMTRRDRMELMESCSDDRTHVFARCARCKKPIYYGDENFEGDEYFEVVDHYDRDVLIVCGDCILRYGRPAPGVEDWQ